MNFCLCMLSFLTFLINLGGFYVTHSTVSLAFNICTFCTWHLSGLVWQKQKQNKIKQQTKITCAKLPNLTLFSLKMAFRFLSSFWHSLFSLIFCLFLVLLLGDWELVVHAYCECHILCGSSALGVSLCSGAYMHLVSMLQSSHIL